MGLLKWLSRRGAVGGTARWAARNYLAARQSLPESSSDADAYRLMISARYKAMPDRETESELLKLADDTQGLLELVVTVLAVEAGFNDNTPENKRMFADVIVEELEKKGLPREAIFGKQG